MGAYENPAMIRDTSGQYIYQGLAGLGAGIAKGMNDYAARNELRRKEMAALAKEEQIKKDALTTDAWKSYDDWSKDLRKSLGPDVSEEVLLNTNRYATEHQEEYLSAYKNRALATTTDQRTSAQSQIDKFNERAALTVKASINYTKTSGNIKDMATKSGATWTSPNDQFAWTLMNNGQAGLNGVENYNVRTEYLDNGHTQLVLDAQFEEGADLTIPGIDVKDGRFTYKVDLNKLNTSNVIATGFEEMDPLETARSLNIVDKDNAFNTRQNQVVFENAKQKVGFYNSAGFLDSMKQQVSAEVNSWWSTSDPETLSKIKATLKGWGMSPTEIDAAVKLGSKSTEEGSMQDALLDRQVSSIFKNGLVGIVDEDVIEKINKINEGRSDEEKFQVPVLNDKYVYSVQTVEAVKETPVKQTVYDKKIEASTYLYQKINDIAGDPKLTPVEVVAELNRIDTKRTFVTGTDYVTRVLKAEKKEGEKVTQEEINAALDKNSMKADVFYNVKDNTLPSIDFSDKEGYLNNLYAIVGLTPTTISAIEQRLPAKDYLQYKEN